VSNVNFVATVVHLSSGRSGAQTRRIPVQGPRLRGETGTRQEARSAGLLIVQYAAFERQLEIMRAGAALAPSEHRRRAENLSQHLQTLRKCRQGVETSDEQTM